MMFFKLLLLVAVTEAVVDPSWPGLAEQFAPKVYFDQQAHKGDCLPDDAGAHYDQCLSSEGCQYKCNNDKDGINDDTYPAYYDIADCPSDDLGPETTVGVVSSIFLKFSFL